MRKRYFYILVLLTFSLVACSKQNQLQSPEPSKFDENKTEIEESTPDEVETEIEQEPIVDTVEPLYKMNPATYSIEPIGDANAKVVLLTIDDAPDKHASDMAKTLKRLDAPAIFFVNGHFIDTDEEKAVLKEIHELGFVIGNHTKTHANLKALSEEEQQDEILTVSDIVEQVTGDRPSFFRAPFGVNTEFSRELAGQEGMLLMNWSFGYDWEKKYMTKEAIADIMVNTELLRNGSNLLMHDRQWTADALEEIVIGLREKGYEFVDPKTIEVPEKN